MHAWHSMNENANCMKSCMYEHIMHMKDACMHACMWECSLSHKAQLLQHHHEEHLCEAPAGCGRIVHANACMHACMTTEPPLPTQLAVAKL